MIAKHAPVVDRTERGTAMVLALFLTSAMSVLGASLMFLSQTETYAGLNYRMMTMARYGAETGVQKAANFLYDATKYTKPGTTGADLLASYDRTGSPVKYNGQPVVLSAIDGVASNYPVASVVTAFQNAAKGNLTAGKRTVGYAASATLLNMQAFDPYGGSPGGAPGVVQTWQITSDGTLGGSKTAIVEVSAIAEQPVWPANSYSAFATDENCGAIHFYLGSTTDSYDSTSISGAVVPTLTASGGDLGTNGNITAAGTLLVKGHIYTPRFGVGLCLQAAVQLLAGLGLLNILGDQIALPGKVEYPTPPLPNPLPGTNNVNITSNTGACAALGFTGVTSGWCTTSGSGSSQKVTIDSGGSPVWLPNVSIGSQVTLEIVAHWAPAQMVYINSLDLTGGGKIAVKATESNQSVLVHLVGKNADGSNMPTVMDFGGIFGGSFTNTSSCTGCSRFDASMLQFIYAGNGLIKFRGSTTAAATFYAPNGSVQFTGGIDLYGSVLGQTVSIGGASIHYDRRLNRDFYVQGSQMLGSFSWKRF